MGKCVKNIALSVMAAIFGALALSGPVFATPTPDTTTPETTETTTVEQPAETPAEAETTTVSCYDQVGSLGWIICPGAGLFGNVIDGAYDLLTQIIEVNPIPTDNNSPTHVVWSYFKDITNSLFIVFLLVIILSQLTGFGINNYGIKKALPRIVIAAILVNLSYIICTVAVDLSNILGNAFQAFFVNVQNIAIENGTISNAASGASVAGIVAAMIGVGAGATFAAGVAFGGASGVIWMLLPVLLSGLLAVISAVITMAARQALIFLLVMVSPLALIAYTLPNTEKWYKKWLNMLAQMLFFYPMFSILYGASQLAGLVIITSATNWLGVVLGIAVKILPLFMSIPLMRMSGSVLGKISGIVNRTATPLTGAVGRYSASKQALAKQKQLAKRNPVLPSTRLAQYLDRQRARRDFDTKELAAANIDRNVTKAKQSWYDKNGKLTKRGLQKYQLIEEQMANATIRMNVETDMDEGFLSDELEKRVRTKDIAKVKAINARFKDDIVLDAAATARKREVQLANAESRAKLIQDHVEKSKNRIHQQVLDTFNINADEYDTIVAKKEARDDAIRKEEIIKKRDSGAELNGNEEEFLRTHGDHMTASDREAKNFELNEREKLVYNSGQKAINATLADAITAKRKVDKEARGNYYELYDNYEAGPRIKYKLIEAFQNGDKNAMSAALEVMYKRGDKDDIGDVLKKYSSLAKDIGFQKELNDICLSFKAEDIDVAQWAKANMMRRGMNGKGKQIEAFIDYQTWAKGEILAGDADVAAARKTSRVELGNALSSWDAIATADRTMWNQILDDQKAGIIAKDAGGKEILPVFPIKYLRSAVCSGKMDGERLQSFNKFFTGGLKVTMKKNARGEDTDEIDWVATRDDSENKFFYDHIESYTKNIEEFLKDMSANQLGTLKTATLETLNNALVARYGNNDSDVIEVEVNGKKKRISKQLRGVLLQTQINQFNTEKSMASQRTAMNPAVRKMLGIKDVLDSNKNR